MEEILKLLEKKRALADAIVADDLRVLQPLTAANLLQLPAQGLPFSR